MRNDRLVEDIHKLLGLMRSLSEESSPSAQEGIKRTILKKLHNKEGFGVLDRVLKIFGG